MVQAFFKADIGDCPLRPDEIKFILLKRQIIHGSDYPFYPVLQTKFFGGCVEFIDRSGVKVEGGDSCLCILRQNHCLHTCAAT